MIHCQQVSLYELEVALLLYIVYRCIYIMNYTAPICYTSSTGEFIRSLVVMHSQQVNFYVLKAEMSNLFPNEERLAPNVTNR